ncbi:MAG TPA: exopolysaccharide biosynthesis polyprenyl glycosylphosphotransferase [Methylocella sp.]|nr:exopolysaccharide biosynthesis polyprenyl glycosylphosphotransferase [Methylocella sp.]
MIKTRLPENYADSSNNTSKAEASFFSTATISCQSAKGLLVVIDFILMASSGLLAYAASDFVSFLTPPVPDVALFAALNGGFFIYSAAMRRLYRLPVLLHPMPHLGRLLSTFAAATVGITGCEFLLLGSRIFAMPWAVIVVLQLAFLLLSRSLFARIARAGLTNGTVAGRCAVTIGEPAELLGISAPFLLQSFGRKEVSRIVLATRRNAGMGVGLSDVLAELDRAIALAKDLNAEEFLIAVRWGNEDLLETVRARLRVSPLPIGLLPDRSMRSLLFQRGGFADTLFAPVTIQRWALTPMERFAKRALDIVVSTLAIAFFAPAFLLVALAIKIDSKGPVIFKQRRSGLNAKEFVIYKFRSMTVLEDGTVVKQARRDDLRVTRVGKFLRRSSLDELPQLFNVLSGDMSLVGPRPHALAHDKEYKAHVADYACRHHVKPGITGWAQVNGLRGETASFSKMAERVKLDLWYISNCSFGLDLTILLRTCLEVLRDRAY